MDVVINDNQAKQFYLTMSVNDVLNCIKNNSESYLQFLDEELDNNRITEEEYKYELSLYKKIIIKEEEREV